MKTRLLLVAILLTAFRLPAEAQILKLQIAGIEEIPHDNDKDECSVKDLPCHTRQEYRVTARNKAADFVLSCKTDYGWYFKSSNEVSYVPLDKPMKACMVFFHVGDTVIFTEAHGGWIPDDGVKDDAMQPFTIRSEKEATQKRPIKRAH